MPSHNNTKHVNHQMILKICIELSLQQQHYDIVYIIISVMKVILVINNFKIKIYLKIILDIYS